MELEEDVCVTFYYLIKFCGISATHNVFIFTSLYFQLFCEEEDKNEI